MLTRGSSTSSATVSYPQSHTPSMAHAHTLTFVQHHLMSWSAVSAFHSSSGRLSRLPIVGNATIRLGSQAISRYQDLETTRRQHLQHSSCISSSQWNSPTAWLPEEVWLPAQYSAHRFHVRYRTQSRFSYSASLPGCAGEFNRATGTRSSLSLQSWLSESIASKTYGVSLPRTGALGRVSTLQVQLFFSHDMAPAPAPYPARHPNGMAKKRQDSDENDRNRSRNRSR
jgi:hypothetical protein